MMSNVLSNVLSYRRDRQYYDDKQLIKYPFNNAFECR